MKGDPRPWKSADFAILVGLERLGDSRYHNPHLRILDGPDSSQSTIIDDMAKAQRQIEFEHSVSSMHNKKGKCAKGAC